MSPEKVLTEEEKMAKKKSKEKVDKSLIPWNYLAKDKIDKSWPLRFL